MVTFGVARSVSAMFNIPSHPLFSRLPQNSIFMAQALSQDHFAKRTSMI
jgi:hypothetical protein